MVSEIIFTKHAQQDFDSIIDFLSFNWTEQITFRFIFHLENALNRIQRSPEGFPFLDEKRSIRKCCLRPHYGIIYMVQNHRIITLSIFDFRQDPEKLNTIAEL